MTREQNNKERPQRPEWPDVFLGLAYLISQRSHDAETQHGCVITTADNRILGMGFNGFLRKCNDDELPCFRPKKYKHMTHSERNAVTNCASKPIGGVAYVTGECCLDCVGHLWQNGVVKIVCADGHGSFAISDEDREIVKEIVKQTGLVIETRTPKLDWARTLLRKLSVERAADMLPEMLREMH